jgi:hypothetical protein
MCGSEQAAAARGWKKKKERKTDTKTHAHFNNTPLAANGQQVLHGVVRKRRCQLRETILAREHLCIVAVGMLADAAPSKPAHRQL